MPGPSSPNILWLVTTQWRAQAGGYAGDPNARTPHLDALAAQSLDYRQAVTPHPFGPFARAALLTGVPSPENGVRDYFDPLPPASKTIAHAMRTRGYHTSFFGKWHLAARARDVPLVGPAHARMIVPPEARGGFEHWLGFEGGFLLNDPWLHGTAAGLAEPRQFSGYQSDVLFEQWDRWLAEQTAARPLFSIVSFEAPHPPYAAPAAGIPPRDPASIVLPANVPRGGEAEVRARRELAGYYAHLEATDRALGRFFARARENWIVVVTSVHGDMHGAQGLFRKGWPHEESIRVPLLIRPASRDGMPATPAFVPGASAAVVSLLDLPALTLRWAGGEAIAVAPPARSAAAISMPSVVALPHQCDRLWRGLRTPTRKLILNADGTPWLFFDLERDPHERQNLAATPAHAAEIATLRAAIS